MSEDDTNNQEIDGDRSIPSVAGNTSSANFGLIMVGFGLLCVVVLYLFWPEGEQIEAGALPGQTDEAFDRERVASFNVPDLPPDPSPLPELTEAQQVVLAQAAPPPPEMSDEERRRLQAEADLRERRKRSPLVIYDSLRDRRELVEDNNGGAFDPEGRAGVSDRQNEILGQIAAANSGNNRGSRDLDTLGDRLENKEVPRVTASYLQDRPYLIAQGKVLGAVIETAISSDLPGMVRAVISESVYSIDGRNLLIEKGSRLIGEYRAGLVQGQGRIFVIWNRVITPNGIDVQITSPGVGPLGRSGHSGWIDSHFVERFGASIMLSLIGAATAQSNDDQFNVEAGENFNDSAEIALENSINIRPTLHKNQGDRIKVFIARDINFKPVLALRSQ